MPAAIRPSCRWLVIATLAALAVVVATPASAIADPPPSAAEAEEALAAASDALAPGDEKAGDDPTLALIELADALPALEGADLRRARALLARPTGGAPGGYTAPPGHTHSWPAPGGAFCVTWVSSTPDRPDPTDSDDNGVPDYVEEIATVAEHSRQVQVDELDWSGPRPNLRPECGDPARADIYLADLGSDGIFGYMATDPGQSSKRRRAGYLIVDNNYSPAQFPGFAEPLDAARVTIAHEFNHLLQVAYSAWQDGWLFEATATWAEERTYPELDDWLRFLPAFARNPGVPITAAFGAGGLKPYGAGVWNHWLDHHYGPHVVREAWASSALTSPRDFAVAAYRRSISRTGGRSFPAEFVRFAAASAEWRAGPLPDAARYPDVRRSGGIGRAQGRGFRLHHTGYRLLGVRAGGGGPIRLRATAPTGLRFGVALVARRGGPVRGRVVRRVRFQRRGGVASVSLRRPGRFNRITAVVVNADPRARGKLGGDWAYRRDGQRVGLRLADR